MISRIIQIRGDQTLEDLHHAIFDAFDHFDEHVYKFQFGKGPMDPKAPRYVLPNADDMDIGDGKRHAGRVDQTTIGSLDLEMARSFGCWFDFGDSPPGKSCWCGLTIYNLTSAPIAPCPLLFDRAGTATTLPDGKRLTTAPAPHQTD